MNGGETVSNPVSFEKAAPEVTRLVRFCAVEFSSSFVLQTDQQTSHLFKRERSCRSWAETSLNLKHNREDGWVWLPCDAHKSNQKQKKKQSYQVSQFVLICLTFILSASSLSLLAPFYPALAADRGLRWSLSPSWTWISSSSWTMSKAFLLDQQSYRLADLRRLRSSHGSSTINIHIKIDMNYLIPSFSFDSGRFKQINFTLLSTVRHVVSCFPALWRQESSWALASLSQCW